MNLKSLITSLRLGVSLLILIGLFFLQISPVGITCLIFIIAWIYNHNTVRPLKRIPFWVTIGILVIGVPIFTGIQDKTFLTITYSSVQLSKTMLMAFRGISVFLLFQVITINLNSEKVTALFTKLGFSNFNSVYTLSNKTMPHLRSILSARVTELRVEWKAHHQLKSVFDFIILVLRDLIRLAESLGSDTSGNEKITPLDFIQARKNVNPPSLTVITGESGTGKSRWLASLVTCLNSAGNNVDGIISEKHRISDSDWHHNLLRIETGEKWQLNTMSNFDTHIHVGKFFFYPDVIEWGCNQLIESIDANYLIIDEIGILEFNGEGFLPALKIIDDNFQGHLIITIRRQLMNQLDIFLKSHLPTISKWKRTTV